MHIAERRLLRRLTLIVQNLRWQIPVLVAATQQPVAQVDVLAIHEEVFVEKPHFINRYTPQEAECTADDLYLCRLVPRQIAHVIVSEATATGEARTKSAHLVEGHSRRGQSTSRLLCIVAVGSKHACAKSTCLRVFFHEPYAFRNRILCHHRIRIEQKHIFALRLSDGNVVCPCETKIMIAGNHADLRELLAKELHRTIVGMVVHNKHLGIDAT